MDSFSILKGLTDATLQRQEILSNNLANIDTKGYVRQDLDFSKVIGDLKNNAAFNNEDSSVAATAKFRDYSKPMNLETEMSKLYENHVKYLLLTKSISHHFEHLKKAIEVKAG